MELQLYNALLEAGVSRETAEKVAVSLEQEVHGLFDRHSDDLAKKSDIAEVKTEIAGLRTAIADTKTAIADTKTTIAEVKADVTKTLLYGLVAVTAIFSAIVKLF